jgi:hypothetical protein
MKTSCRFILILALLLVGAWPAAAQDYAKPSYENLVQTLIRMGALNIADDSVIDDYAVITECKLLASFYKDDFKWNRIRQAIRQSIKQNVATYSSGYAYDAELQLDRYDFKEQSYKFRDRATVKNVNAFVLFSTEGRECADQKIKVLPSSFRAVLNEPIYFTGLPLTENDAKAMLARFDQSGNRDRIVYARFNLRIVFVPPLRSPENTPAGAVVPLQQEKTDGAARLDARLDGLEIYEDAERTKLIFNYQP